jgi:hypothetical protein
MKAAALDTKNDFSLGYLFNPQKYKKYRAGLLTVNNYNVKKT